MTRVLEIGKITYKAWVYGLLDTQFAKHSIDYSINLW